MDVVWSCEEGGHRKDISKDILKNFTPDIEVNKNKDGQYRIPLNLGTPKKPNVIKILIEDWGRIILTACVRTQTRFRLKCMSRPVMWRVKVCIILNKDVTCQNIHFRWSRFALYTVLDPRDYMCCDKRVVWKDIHRPHNPEDCCLNMGVFPK